MGTKLQGCRLHPNLTLSVRSKIGTLTFNKLTTHIDELRILLTNKDKDILLINETKLNENTSHNKIHILDTKQFLVTQSQTEGEGYVFILKKKKPQ